ncbi:aggregation-promoting factor [Vagococcus hydrophili]|uniref:LysM peptidoglycan-binding domain-containing protein n=1 Tax=Vagococcus hydrophili TaxID=2714947 RepID=A0A6G8AQU7_9ENTE|nr:LysM peptidoglycan-binding domain-containing protein [Vagococcus hydrophili]QIL47360.1 LysM peptidoglycan-binding domain-containing protein [Vagococcus hydrophili]
MKSLKTILFGTTAALGLGFFGTSALADTLYTVKSGDTLSKISNEFAGNNSLVQQIAKENNINDVNLIHVGQQLTIRTNGEVAPVQETQPAVEAAPTQEVQQEVAVQPEATTSYSGDSSSAKEWIAQKESGGSYTASNGYHVGRYQLDPNYLNGDYSAENQERVADKYVADRYGSWENAQSFWMSNGWY